VTPDRTGAVITGLRLPRVTVGPGQASTGVSTNTGMVRSVFFWYSA
jgi:hypothetical protein